MSLPSSSSSKDRANAAERGAESKNVSDAKSSGGSGGGSKAEADYSDEVGRM